MKLQNLSTPAKIFLALVAIALLAAIFSPCSGGSCDKKENKVNEKQIVSF